MPDRIAERLLRLIASREVASTITGDLRELAATRGKLWFWLSIARTMSGLLWKDLTSAPRFLAGLGLRGLLVTVCLGTLISFMTLGLLFRVAHSVGFGDSALEGSFTATWFGTIALVQFITGLYLAKRSRGREVASVFAYILIYNATRLIGVVISAALAPPEVAVSAWGIAQTLTAGALGNGHADQVAVFLKFAPLFLAAILVRFRRGSLPSVVRL